MRRVFLFGGPVDGRTFGAVRDTREIRVQEEMTAEFVMEDGPKTLRQPLIHTYVQINRSMMYAHDCRGRCPWPDVPGDTLIVPDRMPDSQESLMYVERWLRRWADSNRREDLGDKPFRRYRSGDYGGEPIRYRDPPEAIYYPPPPRPPRPPPPSPVPERDWLAAAKAASAMYPPDPATVAPVEPEPPPAMDVRLDDVTARTRYLDLDL